MAAVGPLPLLLLAVVVVVDVWVYRDASYRFAAGYPVTVQIGALRIETPEQWAIACVVVFVLAVPLYLTARSR